MINRSLSRANLEKIMEDGNVVALKEIFEAIQLSDENEQLVRLLKGERDVLVDILSIAAMQATHNSLKSRVAWTIVNYVSIVIDLFPFMRKLTFLYENNNQNQISKTIIKAINTNSPSPKVFREIEAMSSSELFALIYYITKSDKINSLDARFIQPIVRGLYGSGAIATSTLFLLMAAYLDSPVEIGGYVDRIIYELINSENDNEGKD